MTTTYPNFVNKASSTGSYLSNMKKKIWITWEVQRRNRSTSAELGFTLFEIIDNRHWLFRYPHSIWQTIKTIRIEKPDTLAVQNPSLVLTLTACLLKPIFRYALIVDAHNAGIKPFEGTKWWANLLTKKAIRTADLTIVTNKSLAEYVELNGGKPAILPDPIPELPCEDAKQHTPRGDDYKIICICSWAEDEPYMEVIKAGEHLPDDIKIFMTGNSKGKELSYDKPLPRNIVITGYLSEESYIRLLCNSDLALVLTNREDCLVCGAYESIAAGIPALLSESRALMEYFGEYAFYTKGDYKSIMQNVVEVRNRQGNKANSSVAAKEYLTAKWLHFKENLISDFPYFCD